MIQSAERIQAYAEASVIVTELAIAGLNGFDSIREKDVSVAVWEYLEDHGYELTPVEDGVEIKKPDNDGNRDRANNEIG